MKLRSALLIGLSTLFLFCTSLTAGSITGNVTYSGSATGTLVVAAFPDSLFDTGPSAAFTSDSVTSYSLTDLSDGTYYIIAFITNSTNNIKKTDPWGIYSVAGKFAPVIISGNNSVGNIDITLVDGTDNNPNPFQRSFANPVQTLQLPSATNAGVDPALAFNGTSIYLYKQDYKGAGSAKIFVINPSNGSVTATNIFTLQSLPNGVSWINSILFVNGALWGTGGYGDPSGSGYREGLFMINIAASSSSNQIPADTSMTLATGLASDGTNFYVAVDSGTQRGLIKFDPTKVSKLPTTYFLKLLANPQSLCYTGGCLWVGVDSLRKLDPASGVSLGSFNVPPAAAGVFVNSLFWMYDQSDNTLKGYSTEAVGVQENPNASQPTNFLLSQNYPNPFNPSTIISYQLPGNALVVMKVYDILGREVKTLVNEHQSAGDHFVQFDAANLPSGVYFYRLEAGAYHDTKKLLLLK